MCLLIYSNVFYYVLISSYSDCSLQRRGGKNLSNIEADYSWWWSSMERTKDKSCALPPAQFLPSHYPVTSLGENIINLPANNPRTPLSQARQLQSDKQKTSSRSTSSPSSPSTNLEPGNMNVNTARDHRPPTPRPALTLFVLLGGKGGNILIEHSIISTGLLTTV